MTMTVEAWLIADRAALTDHYGNSFKPQRLPTRPLEEVSRQDLVKSLEGATSECKNRYDKPHAWVLTGKLDLAKVRSLSNCDRFCIMLEKLIQTTTG